jgi:hypothetical protein
MTETKSESLWVLKKDVSCEQRYFQVCRFRCFHHRPRPHSRLLQQ